MPADAINWAESSVLITGGTGSFGQSFIRTMVEKNKPRRIALLSRDELKQSEMKNRWSEQEVRYFLGDVRDYDRLRRAFHGVDIVVHAAALKQVPAAEADPFEAVLTNIMGGKNVIDAAIDTGVSRVLALSTDKAVAPANLYGATKLVSEKLFVQGNAYSGEGGTRFACARYGNVIGSRGSVIPVFMEQRKTGKITITDERMTRFWISLTQGVQFVIDSLERLQGGEVFVPKIPSMRITDMAEVVAPGCEIEIVGIRPGEKLHEAMLSADESSRTLEYEDHYLIQPAFKNWNTEERFVGGTPVPEGFEYTSDANPSEMSKQDLAKVIEGM
jgi:UDP-N-acetylglucosamine 4,6-dehydratase